MDSPAELPLPPEKAAALLDLGPADQVDWIFEILLGQGPVDKEAAIRTAAEALRDLGLVDFETVARGDPLYTTIDRAIELGVRRGRFDRPRRGTVRAIRAQAKDFLPDDWRLCLRRALGHEPTTRAAALRHSAEWAAENLGLAFTRLRAEGAILGALDAALDEALRRGEFVEAGEGYIRKA